MGGSSSKSNTNQNYKTNIVNIEDVKLLNETMNNFVSDTVVKQASKCTSSVVNIQTIDLSSMDVKGDLVIGEIDQKQKAYVSFDCVQISEFKNEIASGIMDKYIESLKNNFSTEALDKIIASAQSNNKSGFGGSIAPSSSSNTNVNYEFNNTNETHKDISNIIKNSIQNNLKLDDIQECIASIKNSQKITTAGSKVGGNVNIGVIRQDQCAELLTKCMQQKGNVNNVTNNIMKDLGITVDDSASVKKSTDISATTTSVNEDTGVFESIGKGLKSALDGVGGIFSGLLSALMSGPVIIVAVIVIIIIIIVVVFKGLGSIGKSNNKSISNNYDDS